MSRPTSTKSKLKRAFVATASLLTVSAIGGACGTTVQFPEGCPTTLPTDGDGCGSDGLICNDYGGTSDCPGASAECVDGTWYVEFPPPCNPPPPNPCPGDEPVDGSACLEDGKTCTYGPDECGLDVLVTCQGGQWDVGFNSCNPPPPECPPELPTNGELCVEQPNTWGGYPSGCNYPVDTPCGGTTARGGCVDDNNDGEYRWLLKLDDECDPNGTHCSQHLDANVCKADPACQFLVPAGCPSPDGIPANGCYSRETCVPGSCGPGEACTTLQYDPCVDQSCDACMSQVELCVWAD